MAWHYNNRKPSLESTVSRNDIDLREFKDKASQKEVLEYAQLSLVYKALLWLCSVLIIGGLGCMLGILLDVISGLNIFTWPGAICGAIIGIILAIKGRFSRLPNTVY